MNRGGLFEVNTDSFLFFRALEIRVQESLHNHLLSGQADKQEYISAILRNEEIHLLWSKLSTDIDTNSSEELLVTIIEKWLTLRGFAQVSSWVDEYKRASTETVKKKKALRKDLAAKSGKSDDSEKKRKDDTNRKQQKGKRKLLVREEVDEPKRQKIEDSDEKTDGCFSGSYLKKLLSS